MGSFAFVYVIPIGPSALDRHRCADLLDSIRCCEATGAHVFLANDGNDERALRRLLAESGLDGTVVQAPRTTRGRPWLGRLTWVLAHAYRRALREFPGHAVCKLDTDALVVRPFAGAVSRIFAEDPAVGLIGSSGLSADGHSTRSWWTRRVYQLSRWIARWDHPPFVRQNLLGSNRLIRDHVVSAAAHGYVFGASVCGGGYLFRSGALRAVFDLPGMRHLNGCENNALTEDVFYSILACAAGYRLRIQNEPGDAFGVAWRGLPGRTLGEVWERGNAVIHSVKTFGRFEEDATRRFFRQFRRADLSPAWTAQP